MVAGEIPVVQQALYRDRSLVRMLGMRRTMWVVPLDLAGVVQAAATRDIAVRERRRLIQRISPAVTGDVDAWLTDVQESTLRALLARAHVPALFDRSGNIGPTVWWQGRVVGGWARLKAGEVAYRLLEDIGSDGVEAVDRAAVQLMKWVGPTRFVPRFRTPLERELSS